MWVHTWVHAFVVLLVMSPTLLFVSPAHPVASALLIVVILWLMFG
jgi:hypothetical protein